MSEATFTTARWIISLGLACLGVLLLREAALILYTDWRHRQRHSNRSTRRDTTT